MGLFAEKCYKCGHPMGWHDRSGCSHPDYPNTAAPVASAECTCKNFEFTPGCYKCNSHQYDYRVERAGSICPVISGNVCVCECHARVANGQL